MRNGHKRGPALAQDGLSEQHDVAQSPAAAHAWCQELPFSEDEAGFMSGKTRSSLVKRARLITYVSLAVTLAGGVSGIAAAVALDSAAVLGYALESFVDVWSSILVLWRFWGDGSSEAAAAMAQREKWASFGISMSFLGISFMVGKEALGHIQAAQGPEQGGMLLLLAAASVIVLSALCGLKLDLSRKLRSESLRKDAITSGAVAVLSAAIVVSTLMYSANASLWWFDSVVALGISLALCCAGAASLISTKWWSRSFWTGAPESLLQQRGECSLL